MSRGKEAGPKKCRHRAAVRRPGWAAWGLGRVTAGHWAGGTAGSSGDRRAGGASSRLQHGDGRSLYTWLLSQSQMALFQRKILENPLNSSRGLYCPAFCPSRARGGHPEPLTARRGAFAASSAPRVHRSGTRGCPPGGSICHGISEMPLPRMSAGRRLP